MTHTALIGVGNSWRGDDGAGIEVARRFAACAPPGVSVRAHDGGDHLGLLELWRQADEAVVVDAARSGAPAGTVRRFDAAAAPLPTAGTGSWSHALGVAEAIELARALDRLPRSLVVYAIEGREFGAGRELSVEVERAVAGVVAELRGRWAAPAGA